MSNHAAALREPWHKLTEQRRASTFGLWVFLASEMTFFGAFFLAYAYLRVLHPEAFAVASRHAAVTYGTVNSALLLTSGLTMVLASRAADIDLRPLVLVCLGLTAVLGVAFLVVKGFEYRKDIADGLVPAHDFKLDSVAAQLFWSLYWVVTAVHAVHLTIGVVLITRLALLVGRDRLPVRSPQLEVAALYWAFVDIVWILLYPLIYLGGRAS